MTRSKTVVVVLGPRGRRFHKFMALEYGEQSSLEEDKIRRTNFQLLVCRLDAACSNKENLFRWFLDCGISKAVLFRVLNLTTFIPSKSSPSTRISHPTLQLNPPRCMHISTLAPSIDFAFHYIIQASPT